MARHIRILLLISTKNIGNNMITLQEPLINITMEVKMNFSQCKILDFLKQKGYNIEAFRQCFPSAEQMLVSEEELVKYTFVALKQGEKPNENNLYLKVFERELQNLLNDI